MVDGEKLLDKIMDGYTQCSKEIQAIVDEMSEIYEDKTSTEDERRLAFNTIIDALEPFLSKEEIKLLMM
jgi:hypothetical protein